MSTTIIVVVAVLVIHLVLLRLRKMDYWLMEHTNVQWIAKIGWWYYSHTVQPVEDVIFWLRHPHIVYCCNNGIYAVALKRDYKKARQEKREMKIQGTDMRSVLVTVKPTICYAPCSHDKFKYVWPTFSFALFIRNWEFVIEYATDLYVPFSNVSNLERDIEMFPRSGFEKVEKYIYRNGRKG